MKIIKRILMIFVMMFVPTVVFAAGSVSPNTTSLTIEQGGSASFTVTATNAAGRIDVTSNNSSIASLTSSSSAFVDNNSATFTLNGVSAGSTTVKLALTDVATYDNEVLDNVYTINVTVFLTLKKIGVLYTQRIICM